MKKTIKQINNLKIKHDDSFPAPYQVYSPDGRCLEEFYMMEGAERFCKTTLDFVRRPRKPTPCRL